MPCYAFRLPEGLTGCGFSIREEQEADTQFLLALYASTRAEELAPLPWSDDEKAGFVAQQFGAQRFHYRTQLTNCAFLVIERDGEPIGRLYLQELETRLHIVDIALMLDSRGQGIGNAIVGAVVAQAAEMGKGVGLFVEPFNPARRLYERHGLRTIKDDAIHMEMELPAPSTDVAR